MSTVVLALVVSFGASPVQLVLGGSEPTASQRAAVVIALGELKVTPDVAALVDLLSEVKVSRLQRPLVRLFGEQLASRWRKEGRPGTAAELAAIVQQQGATAGAPPSLTVLGDLARLISTEDETVTALFRKRAGRWERVVELDREIHCQELE
jgi:hypothetical protein